MKFRKKPVVVEAVQWFKNGDASHAPIIPVDNDHPEAKCMVCGNLWDAHANCKTLEGFHIVCPGDWIITGVHGEHYPCKPDIFEKTYEPAK